MVAKDQDEITRANRQRVSNGEMELSELGFPISDTDWLMTIKVVARVFCDDVMYMQQCLDKDMIIKLVLDPEFRATGTMIELSKKGELGSMFDMARPNWTITLSRMVLAS